MTLCSFTLQMGCTPIWGKRVSQRLAWQTQKRRFFFRLSQGAPKWVLMSQHQQPGDTGIDLLVTPGHWSAHLFVEREEQESSDSTNRSTLSKRENPQWIRSVGMEGISRPDFAQTSDASHKPLLNIDKKPHFIIQVQYYQDAESGSGQAGRKMGGSVIWNTPRKFVSEVLATWIREIHRGLGAQCGHHSTTYWCLVVNAPGRDRSTVLYGKWKHFTGMRFAFSVFNTILRFYMSALRSLPMHFVKTNWVTCHALWLKQTNKPPNVVA